MPMAGGGIPMMPMQGVMPMRGRMPMMGGMPAMGGIRGAMSMMPNFGYRPGVPGMGMPGLLGLAQTKSETD